MAGVRNVSFGTYRLEPVRMAFGQAAGIGAYYCIRYGLAAREVPARQIQDDLLPHFANPYGDTGVMLTYFSDLKPDNPHYLAIQYLAARGFRPTGDTFAPAAPTTRGELAAWLTLLAERASPSPKIIARNANGTQTVERGFVPYMGMPANRDALMRLQKLPDPGAVATRREIAEWMSQILPQVPTTAPNRYSDIDKGNAETVRATAQLAAHGIDSVLWDSWSAFAPDGSLLFQPDAPLRHDATFESLYIAQIGLGPAFNDHPLDGGKGRAVPSGIMESVTERH